ncbi:S-adenosyl-L-methionine-dependent methyltransferase [Chlamydoabsidia padenii]|nr:S-adenosyl-L-methionine-dependent methyltransferase [Chlamydoabsidia padenii]
MLILLYGILLPIIYLYTEGYIKDLLLYAHACGFIVWCHTSPHPKDMYGLKHFRLNLELPPRTFWCNTGYWTDGNATDFVGACQRLVSIVINKLNVHAGDRLLDVGYGCGDSCFFIADQFDCQVTGITNEYGQWKFSQDRLDKLGKHHQDNIKLLQGSAVELGKVFEGKKATTSFDHIISIDSAYHYDTRRAFFNQAKDYLKPGGTLGMYDLVLHDNVDLKTKWKQVLLTFICKFLSLPVDNLVNQMTYRAYLEQAGYTDIQFESLPRDQVFGGLSRHILRQRHQMKAWRLGNWQDLYYLTTSSFLFGQLACHEWLQPTVIIAKYGDPSD